MKKIRPYISILLIVLSAAAAFEFIPGVSPTSWINGISSIFGNWICWAVAFLLAGVGIALFSMTGIIKVKEFVRSFIARLCWGAGAALVGVGGYFLMKNVSADSVFSGRLTIIIIYALTILFTIVTFLSAVKKAGNKVSSGAIRRSASSSGAFKYSFKYFYSSLVCIILVGIVSVFFKGTVLPCHYLIPSAAVSALMLLFFFLRIKVFTFISLATLLLQVFIVLYNGLYITNLRLLPYYSSVLFFSCAVVVSMIDIYCREKI